MPFASKLDRQATYAAVVAGLIACGIMIRWREQAAPFLVGLALALQSVALFARVRRRAPIVGVMCAALAFAALPVAYFHAPTHGLGPFIPGYSDGVPPALSILSALAFSALALLSLDRLRGPRNLPWSAWLAATAFIIGASTTLTRAFANVVTSSPNGVSDTLVSLGLLALAPGIMLISPGEQIQRILLAPTAAGVLARRGLGAITLLPAFLCGLTVVLVRQHLIEPHESLSLIVGGLLFSALVVAVLSAETALTIDRRREEAEEERASLNDQLRQQAAELQGKIEARTAELRDVNHTLQAVNHRLALATRASAIGVWEWDLASNQHWRDERSLEIYGLDHRHLGQDSDPWAGRMHPDDESRVRAALHLAWDQGGDFDQEFRIVRGDNGDVRHVQSRGRVQRDSTGKGLRIVGTERDVTAEKSAAAELSEVHERLRVAEERWQLALEGSNDGVWDWDMVSGVCFHDEAWARMLGYELNEVGHDYATWMKLMHPHDLPQAEAAVQAHINGQTPFYNHEHRMRAKNGEWRWILDRGKIVNRNAEGKPLRMAGTHSDVTERKRLEQRLTEAEQLALQVSQLARIGGWYYDPVARELTWSSLVKEIHDLPESEQPSFERALTFMPPEARTRLESAYAVAVLAGKPFDLELPATTAKGRRIWLQIIGRPEFRDGIAVRIRGAMQDVTARHETSENQRQLEERLFQTQKIETLGTLAGGIAHDFNNLLTGIIGYHELAAESLPEDHSARACLAEAHTASLRARELVEQILTFSRPPVDVEHGMTDLTEVVEEARKFLRATLPSTISVKGESTLNGQLVLADATQIHQVILNLGSNAGHAMRDKGGTLTISLRWQEVGAEKGAALGIAPGEYGRVSVSDTGHGMDETTMRRIFDPFFTTKNSREGTGLGLAVVHGIVQAHRGGIEVESRPNGGATFHVYIPGAPPEARPVETKMEAPEPGGGEMIYVVDDEEQIAECVAAVLQKRGYRTLQFTSAQACLDAVGADQPACAALVTDLTMPDIVGTELVLALRKLRPQLPAVIMSGYFSKISADTLDELNPIELLPKPYTGDELTRAVQRALGTLL